jgi:hypothetical protein
LYNRRIDGKYLPGYEDEAATKKLLDHVLQQIPAISTLLYTINPKWNDTIYDLEPQYIWERLCDGKAGRLFL